MKNVVEHVGNVYSRNEIGGIKLLTDKNNQWNYVELKMSESKEGRGILANISQNALTNYKLFNSNNNIISWWSEFRAKNNFQDQILREFK
ncbi:MAG: hypothetical protein ACTSXH_08230 [Promethearchaeota archaeon]